MTNKNRGYLHYLDDMHEAMSRILRFTEGLTFQEFESSTLKTDAVIRNLEIIGEASKNVPDHLKNKYPQIPWRSMYGLRNYVVHEYFGIDLENIWKIIEDELPDNAKDIERILHDENKS